MAKLNKLTERKEEIIRLYKKEMKASELAKYLGVSKSVLFNFIAGLRKAGCKDISPSNFIGKAGLKEGMERTYKRVWYNKPVKVVYRYDGSKWRYIGRYVDGVFVKSGSRRKVNNTIIQKPAIKSLSKKITQRRKPSNKVSLFTNKNPDKVEIKKDAQDKKYVWDPSKRGWVLRAKNQS